MLSATAGGSGSENNALIAAAINMPRPLSPYTRAIAPALDGKIDPKLWAAVGKIDEEVAKGAFTAIAGSSARASIDFTNIARAKVTADGAIHVYAEMNSFTANAIAAIKGLGLEIVSMSEKLGVVETWVPYSTVDDLAGLAAVRLVRLVKEGIARTGLVNSAGDGILNADDVRSRFTAAIGNLVDGSGIRIGVISDGVQNRNLVQAGATPDLPAISVNPSRPGSGDEGTAMLEIIHDLAPGAQLFFSSGIAGSLAMLDSIDWLFDQNVDIIVDDLGFYDEHYFSDTAIAQAVADVVADGVTYVTAAGNDAQFHYQGLANFVNGIQDFDATAATDNVLNIGNVPIGGTVIVDLQWSDAWTTSANDYDLRLFNVGTATYVASSFNTQNGTQHPYESIAWTNTTGAPINLGIVIDDFNNPAVRMLELYAYADFALTNLADANRTQADSIFGHHAVESAITVAAVNAGDPGNDTVAAYSSQGASTIFTNFVTQASTARASLDGTGIDGVQTRIGQLGFFVNPFFGTSAAAPHVAAIAGLLLDANPGLTPAMVSDILRATAIDLGAVGYDNVSGAGRFDALAAVYRAFTPALPQLSAASDTGQSNSDRITSDTTPTFTGTVPANSFVRLYVDGIERGTQQLAGGSTSFSITTPALTDGNHNVTIRVAETAAVAAANLSNSSASLSFTIDTVPPRVTDVRLRGSSWSRAPISYRDDSFFGEALTGGGGQLKPIPIQGINWIEIEFSEQMAGLTNQSLRVLTSGAPIVPATVHVDPQNTGNPRLVRWVLQNPLPTGFYTLSLNQNGNVADRPGGILDGEWNNPELSSDAPGTSSTFASGNNTAGGEFRFDFSVMPGDYNRNFAGDAADFTIWANTEGSTTVLWADGNGNGIVNPGQAPNMGPDWTIWKLLHGTMLPGDHNGSGAVDHLDHNIWKSQFGTTVLEGTGADANFDEVVDIDDYLIWRANEGYQNPWLGEGTIGEPSLVIDEAGAPYVTGVAVAGSNSTHADYDFAGAVGSGQQLKTVPLGGLDTIRITFNEDVFVESSDLTLIGMQGQTIPAVDSFDYDLETCTATWVFASVLPAAQYLIRLLDDIHDIWENQLDGEFENAWALADAAGTSDTFPSGDGVAGGEFRFRFTNLASDYDRTNIVSLNDLSTLAVNNNLTPATHQQGDGSGDGLVQSANGTPDKLLMDAEWAKNYTVWPSYEPGLIRVTTLSDESDGNYAAGDLSLREALAIAYSQSGHDTIVFAQSLFTSGPATMTLTYDGADAGTAADQLIVDSSVSVVGPGQELLTLNGNNQNRLFWVQSGHSASISGMSMVNGNPSSSGGAIFNSGNLSLDRVTIADNVGAYGGGIYNHGTIRVLNSTISDNTATNVGGGLMSHADTALAVVVENSAIIGNEAPIGGGLYLHVWSAGSGGRSARITNSTVSGNNATTDGGGVAVIGGTTLTVVQSTITDNHAKAGGSVGKGGGIYAINSMTKLQNSIVADNTAEHAYSEDIFANWTIDGTSSNNLIGSDGNSALVNGTNGNIVGSWLAPISPGLSVLGDYGGATLTHRLLSTSSAIDAGSNAAAADYLGNPLASDQRGYTRLFDVPGVNGSGAKVDIGAFEYSTAQVTNITLSSTTTNSYGTNPPYSFATAVGSEEQIRTVPVGNANRIAIQFSKDVDVSSSDLEIIALNRVVTEPTPTLIEGPSSGNGYTATWSLSSVLPDAQYLIRLSDSIVDLDGSALDGEWVNAGSILSSVATSIFPSGDNVAGGDFEFVFTYLRGDANRDLQVTGADLAILSAHLNQGGNKSWANGDFTGDGTVSGSDFGLQTATLNKSDWRNLQILGDYDSNFDLDEDDETAFLDFFNASNISADLNKDSVVNTADYDAFYELYDFEPSLAVLT